MNLLVDTHVLIWLMTDPRRLNTATANLLGDVENTVWFSSVSIWEIAIKRSLNRPDFLIEPDLFYRTTLAQGHRELAVDGAHACAMRELPPVHKDPFDRMLVAQARLENMRLLTSDSTLGKYGFPVMLT